MNTFIQIEEQKLETISGGGWLMETGSNLAAAGQADVRTGNVSAGASGLNTTGTVLIGLLELVAGGWLMIGGLVEEAFE